MLDTDVRQCWVSGCGFISVANRYNLNPFQHMMVCKNSIWCPQGAWLTSRISALVDQPFDKSSANEATAGWLGPGFFIKASNKHGRGTFSLSSSSNAMITMRPWWIEHVNPPGHDPPSHGVMINCRLLKKIVRCKWVLTCATHASCAKTPVTVAHDKTLRPTRELLHEKLHRL